MCDVVTEEVLRTAAMLISSGICAETHPCRRGESTRDPNGHRQRSSGYDETVFERRPSKHYQHSSSWMAQQRPVVLFRHGIVCHESGGFYPRTLYRDVGRSIL